MIPSTYLRLRSYAKLSTYIIRYYHLQKLPSHRFQHKTKPKAHIRHKIAAEILSRQMFTKLTGRISNRSRFCSRFNRRSKPLPLLNNISHCSIREVLQPSKSDIIEGAQILRMANLQDFESKSKFSKLKQSTSAKSRFSHRRDLIMGELEKRSILHLQLKIGQQKMMNFKYSTTYSFLKPEFRDSKILHITSKSKKFFRQLIRH